MLENISYLASGAFPNRLELTHESKGPENSMYPFTYLDFRKKSGKLPEGRLSNI
jgi:hypothetical protein